MSDGPSTRKPTSPMPARIIWAGGISTTPIFRISIGILIILFVCFVVSMSIALLSGAFVLSKTPTNDSPTETTYSPLATATNNGVTPIKTIKPTYSSTPKNNSTRTPTKPKTSAPTFTPMKPKTSTPTLTPSFDWSTCHAVYETRLQVGDKAYVSNNPPLSNNVREKPYKDSTLLGKIEPGEEMTIIKGPSCSNGWIWWKVTAKKDGLTGWTAEGDADAYWLVPKK